MRRPAPFSKSLSACTLCVCVAAAGTAGAEGPGIRLGSRMVMHAGITTEFRYDSNVFFEPGNESQAGRFRLQPSISFATRPQQRLGGEKNTINFRVGAAVDYNEFLTPNAQLSQHRWFGVLANAMLNAFPGRKFSFDIFDNFVRTVQPPYTSGTPYNLDRDTNELGFRMSGRPSSGRIQIDFSYAFGLDFFEPVALRDFNVFYHRFNVRGQWRFFPKTALYLDIRETPTHYPNRDQFYHPNSFPLRVIAGVNGYFTTKLTLNLWAGYGNGFYVYDADPRNTSGNPNPNTGIGGMEVTWKPTQLSSGALGYKHEFVNALVGAYYDVDTVFVRWTQNIWRFSAGTSLTYSNLRFQGINQNQLVVDPNMPNVPATDRMDHNVVFALMVGYNFKDWLSLAIGYDMQYNTSNRVLNFGGMGPMATLVPANYLKHEAFLRMVVNY